MTALVGCLVSVLFPTHLERKIGAGIEGYYSPEIIDVRDRGTAKTSVGQGEQIAILRVATKVEAVRLYAPLFPDTITMRDSDAKEWVERRCCAIVSDREQRTAATGCPIAGSLDSGQIGFKSHTTIVEVITGTCRRAGKADRRWVKVGIPIGPCILLVGYAIKTSIRAKAARNWHQ